MGEGSEKDGEIKGRSRKQKGWKRSKLGSKEGKETNKRINQELKMRDEKKKKIRVNQQGSVTIKEEKMERLRKTKRRMGGRKEI